jgi:hypothetical protein
VRGRAARRRGQVRARPPPPPRPPTRPLTVCKAPSLSTRKAPLPLGSDYPPVGYLSVSSLPPSPNFPRGRGDRWVRHNAHRWERLPHALDHQNRHRSWHRHRHREQSPPHAGPITTTTPAAAPPVLCAFEGDLPMTPPRLVRPRSAPRIYPSSVTAAAGSTSSPNPPRVLCSPSRTLLTPPPKAHVLATSHSRMLLASSASIESLARGQQSAPPPQTRRQTRSRPTSAPHCAASPHQRHHPGSIEVVASSPSPPAQPLAAPVSPYLSVSPWRHSSPTHGPAVLSSKSSPVSFIEAGGAGGSGGGEQGGRGAERGGEEARGGPSPTVRHVVVKPTAHRGAWLELHADACGVIKQLWRPPSAPVFATANRQQQLQQQRTKQQQASRPRSAALRHANGSTRWIE